MSTAPASIGGAVLLDTNVLSELLRAQPDTAVLDWFAAQDQDQLLVSAVTQAEMLLGAMRLPAGKRRVQLQAAVEALFSDDFAGRVLSFDTAAAAAYATVVAARRRAGRPISQFDAQIAAIAASRRAALATRNTADFEGCGVDLHNPWKPAS
jgi:predicted nucleic acid-binding protein